MKLKFPGFFSRLVPRRKTNIKRIAKQLALDDVKGDQTVHRYLLGPSRRKAHRGYRRQLRRTPPRRFNPDED